jgi:large subunit ribosomal protein L28
VVDEFRTLPARLFWLGEIRWIPVKSTFRQQAWKDFRVMARVCDICGKGPQFGNTISHAHNVSKRRWNVNLRPVHAKVGPATKHIRVCTSCLRSGKVVKA